VVLLIALFIFPCASYTEPHFDDPKHMMKALSRRGTSFLRSASGRFRAQNSSSSFASFDDMGNQHDDTDDDNGGGGGGGGGEVELEPAKQFEMVKKRISMKKKNKKNKNKPSVSFSAFPSSYNPTKSVFIEDQSTRTFNMPESGDFDFV
jgi:hypothetical protein